MNKTAEARLYRSVLYRALYDALGFTGLPKQSDEHGQSVDEARRWFFEATEDFEMACDIACLDERTVRLNAVQLIEARQSGDYSRIAAFWRDCFKRNRAPSYGALQKDVDSYRKLL